MRPTSGRSAVLIYKLSPGDLNLVTTIRHLSSVSKYHSHGRGVSHLLSPLLRLSLLARRRTNGGGKRKVRSQSWTEVGTRDCDSTVDLIEAAGFPVETHHVTTSDGYILALHRYDAPPKIPNPLSRDALYHVLLFIILRLELRLVQNTEDEPDRENSAVPPRLRVLLCRHRHEGPGQESGLPLVRQGLRRLDDQLPREQILS